MFPKCLAFSRNFGKILEVCTRSGLGAESIEASDLIKNIVQKSMETSYSLEIFLNYEKIWLWEANLNKDLRNYNGLLQIFSKSKLNQEA